MLSHGGFQDHCLKPLGHLSGAFQFSNTAAPLAFVSGACYGKGRRKIEEHRKSSTWRGGREAEGGGLLNRYTAQKLYRGFESLPLRPNSGGLRASTDAPFEARRQGASLGSRAAKGQVVGRGRAGGNKIDCWRREARRGPCFCAHVAGPGGGSVPLRSGDVRRWRGGLARLGAVGMLRPLGGHGPGIADAHHAVARGVVPRAGR